MEPFDPFTANCGRRFRTNNRNSEKADTLRARLSHRSRLLHGGQRGAKIGIVPRGTLLHFSDGRQRNAGVKIFGKFKIVV